jgi:hypothetical protein
MPRQSFTATAVPIETLKAPRGLLGKATSISALQFLFADLAVDIETPNE